MNTFFNSQSKIYLFYLIDQPFCDYDGITHADQQHIILCSPKCIENRENLLNAIDASGIPQPILLTHLITTHNGMTHFDISLKPQILLFHRKSLWRMCKSRRQKTIKKYTYIRRENINKKIILI